MFRKFKGPFHFAHHTNTIENDLAMQQCAQTWIVHDTPIVCDQPGPEPQPEELIDELQSICVPGEAEKDDPMAHEEIICLRDDEPAAPKSKTPELTLSLRKRISLFDVVKHAKRQSFKDKIDAIREMEH